MKLVRDKIPLIIQATGKSCISHVANDQEFHDLLVAKLQEEVAEFLHDNNPEELADIIEVIHAIAEQEYGGYSTIEMMRLAKKEERGGFSQRIVLEKIYQEKKDKNG